MEYLLYFFLAAGLSTLFAMGGAGAGIAMIPVLHMLGIEFNLAKAVGLFVGFTTTFTSSVMNFRHKVLDIWFALPLALSLLICAPIGAQLSRFVDEKLVKGIFILFLIFSASMMMFFQKKGENPSARAMDSCFARYGRGFAGGSAGSGRWQYALANIDFTGV